MGIFMLYQLDIAVVFANYRRSSCSFFSYGEIHLGRSPPVPNFDKFQNSEFGGKINERKN